MRKIKFKNIETADLLSTICKYVLYIYNSVFFLCYTNFSSKLRVLSSISNLHNVFISYAELLEVKKSFFSNSTRKHVYLKIQLLLKSFNVLKCISKGSDD